MLHGSFAAIVMLASRLLPSNNRSACLLITSARSGNVAPIFLMHNAIEATILGSSCLYLIKFNERSFATAISKSRISIVLLHISGLLTLASAASKSECCFACTFSSCNFTCFSFANRSCSIAIDTCCCSRSIA